MAQLYKRICVVIVDGVRIEGLRTRFTVRKGLRKEPNTAEIQITNLSATTRALIRRRGAAVVLSAGYVGESAILFQGDARTIDHMREGAEWRTVIRCGDGERAIQWARFSQAFPPGTAAADVLRAAAASLGVGLGNVEQTLAAVPPAQFAHGYTASATASREIDRLCRLLGLEWSIQDGALQMLPARKPAAGGAVLLSPTTGLIGSPEHVEPDKKGKPSPVKFRSLINPRITCGGVVALQSAGVAGQFRVETLAHEGDTHGAEWYSSGEGLPI